jgi:hypothetical protein
VPSSPRTAAIRPTCRSGPETTLTASMSLRSAGPETPQKRLSHISMKARRTAGCLSPLRGLVGVRRTIKSSGHLRLWGHTRPSHAQEKQSDVTLNCAESALSDRCRGGENLLLVRLRAAPRSNRSATAPTTLPISYPSRGQRKRPASPSFAAANIQKLNRFVMAATQSCLLYVSNINCLKIFDKGYYHI